MKVVYGATPGSPVSPQAQSETITRNQSPKERAIEAWKKASSQPAEEQKVEAKAPQVAEIKEEKAPEALHADTSGDASSQEAPPAQAEAPKAETPSEPISPQYAALARREKANRANLLRDRAAFEAEKAQWLKANAPQEKPSFDPSKYVSREDLLKNPLNVLADLGVSYDTVVEQAVNAPKDSDIRIMQLEKQLAEKDKALADKIDKLEKSMAERETNAYKQAIKQVESKVNKLVDANADYETIKATGSQRDVVELIEKTFKEDGIVLTEDEAAKEVEAYLVEEFDKLSKISKLQKRLKPAETSSQQAVKSDVTKQDTQQQLKTLTNSVNSTAPKLSQRERALRAFRGEKIN